MAEDNLGLLLEQPENAAEREICLYDQIKDPQHNKQIIVQYICPISNQVFLSTDPVPRLEEMGLLE